MPTTAVPGIEQLESGSNRLELRLRRLKAMATAIVERLQSMKVHAAAINELRFGFIPNLYAGSDDFSYAVTCGHTQWLAEEIFQAMSSWSDWQPVRSDDNKYTFTLLFPIDGMQARVVVYWALNSYWHRETFIFGRQ